jgi:hypothetical protein
MVYGYVPAYDDAPNRETEETVAVLECENCGKACEKLHDVPEFNYKGCDVCMEEAQHALAREIWEHFGKQQDWKWHEKTRYANGLIDKWGDRYIDLSGDSGFTWVLNVFSHGDINGIAVLHWVFKAEGDTLTELLEALK